MNFRYLMPTKVLFGADCIMANTAEFSRWGKRAFIITGRNSARISGALADVEQALRRQNMEWEMYDQITENPTIALVEEAGALARKYAPNVIVAIGGGSPLDAAKAVAVLAVNAIPGAKLFDGNFAVEPLPVLAIPLTAGTGSEVTPYSILTDAERQTKRSFADPGIFPQVAFLDARYTESLSSSVTVNSAIDALSHAIEGYLSRRSTPISDCLALEAIKQFGSVKQSLFKDKLEFAEREALLYVSLLGGAVIAQTATTAVHALGYSLTYFHGIPHGRANGLLLAEYLRYNEPAAAEKIGSVLAALGMDCIDDFGDYLRKLLPCDERFTVAELENFARIASMAANTVNSPRQPNKAELQQILAASLPVSRS